MYFCSSVASNASLDTEINCRIGKASGTFARLTTRVWDNSKLSISTKSNIHCACVCSTPLYVSETWTLSSVQETKINTFHLRYPRCILKIRCQQKFTNNVVLRRTGLTTMYQWRRVVFLLGDAKNILRSESPYNFKLLF